MKLLILGASGDLGHAVGTAASSRGWDTIGLSRRELDVTDHAALASAIKRATPGVVVNCTAYHLVDQCERNPMPAHVVNVAAVSQMATVCKAIGARLVHVSTNYVFDGLKTEPYVESDMGHPVNRYGLSKWLGEAAITRTSVPHLIVRTSCLFGGRGKSSKGGDFVWRMLEKARKSEPLLVVSDQTVAPTDVDMLAGAMLDLIAAGAQRMVHLANGGECTWAELAEQAIGMAGLTAKIERVSSAAMVATGSAPRPPYSVLRSQRGLSTIERVPYQEPLRRYVERLAAKMR